MTASLNCSNCAVPVLRQDHQLEGPGRAGSPYPGYRTRYTFRNAGAFDEIVLSEAGQKLVEDDGWIPVK